MIKVEDVPCGNCHLCCKNDMIVLHPECGDDETVYKTEKVAHPFTGDDVLMLTHKENGDCIYLGDRGCENYENRPAICREYDCRRQYLSMTKAMMRKAVERNLFTRAQLDAGKKRAHTLNHVERQECIKLRASR